MVLTQDEFYELPMTDFGNVNLRMIGDQLGKHIGGSTKEPFIKYLSTLNIPGVILPKELIMTPKGKIFGYIMPIVPDSVSIENYIYGNEEDDLPFDVVAIIKEIFQILSRINKHFVVSDIHNGNILITQNSPYIIDCDNGVHFGQTPRNYSYLYTVGVNYTPIKASILSDVVKALISAISLFYHYDFEEDLDFQDMIALYKKLTQIQAPEAFIRYLDYLIEQAVKDNLWEIENFSKFSTTLMPPTEKDLQRIRERM